MNSLLSPPSSLAFFTIPNPTQLNPLSAEAAAKVQLSIPFGKEKFEKNFSSYPERDLNPHDLIGHGILSPACLPVSPSGPGAGNETRTRDPNLGKVVLYQLSYSRNLQ